MAVDAQTAPEARLAGGEGRAAVAGLRVSSAGASSEVLVLEIDAPPRNALEPATRAALMAAIARATEAGPDGGPAFRAILLCAAGRNFSSATLIERADGDEAARPTLAELCLRVEAAPIPVVIALHGATLGPAAELALAAHARVAAADLRLALPDAGFGLVPEAGASQRLPRLVGPAEALEMLLHARPTGAEEGLAIGLIDRLVEGDAPDLRREAVGLALAMAGPRPTSARTEMLADVPAWTRALAPAREALARSSLPAPARICDCVEAALYLPFENGLALEAVAREDLHDTDEARGLLSAARAERRALTLPATVQRAEARALRRIGFATILPQSALLARLALARGHEVRLFDADPARLAKAEAWIAEREAAELRAGRLSAAQRDADRARFAAGADPMALAGSDLLIHGADAAPLARIAPAAIDLRLWNGAGDAQAAALPGLVIAPGARICELALPRGVAPVTVASLHRLLRDLGMQVLITGPQPGLGRSLVLAGRSALARLLDLGVPRRRIAQVLEDFGQTMPELPDPADPAPMRAMPEDEILRRWLGAMANAGFALLEAGSALRPSDLDHLMVMGHGFPRWRGGPMLHARVRGLMVLRADLSRWGAEDRVWRPNPLIGRLIAEGRRLEDLDAL